VEAFINIFGRAWTATGHQVQLNRSGGADLTILVKGGMIRPQRAKGAKMKEITKVKAKAIIVEIVRQCGGSLVNKTNLYKAFWKSHVAAVSSGELLSVYPIVKMPRGPGIDNFSHLLAELVLEDAIDFEDQQAEFDSFQIRLIRDDAYADTLSEEDKAAIAAGVEYVRGKTAHQVSVQAYADSRVMAATPTGRLLDIEMDAMSDEDHEKLTEQHQRLSQVMAKVREGLGSVP
jgi:hypothetical protein